MGPQLYVAAKKEKTLQERNKNLQQSSQARKKKKRSQKVDDLPTVDEDVAETFDAGKNDLALEENQAITNANVNKNDLVLEDDLMTEETFVPEIDPGNAYVVTSRSVTYDLKVNTSYGKKLVLAVSCCCTTTTAGATQLEIEELFDGGWRWWSNLCWIALCVLAFVVGFFLRSCGEQRRLRLATSRLTEADRTANAMALLVPKLQKCLEQAHNRIVRLQSAYYEEASGNYGRIAQAYNDAVNNGGDTPIGFRTAFTELNELRGLHDEGIRIMGRAIAELEYHMEQECPYHMVVNVLKKNPHIGTQIYGALVWLKTPPCIMFGHALANIVQSAGLHPGFLMTAVRGWWLKWNPTLRMHAMLLSSRGESRALFAFSLSFPCVSCTPCTWELRYIDVTSWPFRLTVWLKGGIACLIGYAWQSEKAAQLLGFPLHFVRWWDDIWWWVVTTVLSTIRHKVQHYGFWMVLVCFGMQYVSFLKSSLLTFAFKQTWRDICQRKSNLNPSQSDHHKTTSEESRCI